MTLHRRIVRWSGAALPLWLGCAAAPHAGLIVDDPPVIDLREGVVEILSHAGPLDSPALSADGKRLAVQVVVYRDSTLPYEIHSLGVAEKTGSDRWSNLKIMRKGIVKRFLGKMVMPIQPAFDETNNRLLLTHLEFGSILSIPLVPSVRSWVERVSWNGDNAERIVEHPNWGFASNEIIQHPRVSPDGRWLAFYVHVNEPTRGIYLLDLRTGEQHRLCEAHDKHPTWSPDGKRLYFHHGIGGRRHRFDLIYFNQERAYLGYFDLKFEDDRLIGWRRSAFGGNEPGARYVYHKHPAEIAGTGLLFFHGRLEPDGKLKLMVRSTEPGSEVYVVKPYWKGKPLKAAKHPCASFDVANLVFIGKPKGEKTYRLLLSLTHEALTKVQRAVRGDLARNPGSRPATGLASLARGLK